MAEKKKDERMFQRLTVEVMDKDKRRKTVTFKITGQSNRGEKFGSELYDDGIGQWQGIHYRYRSADAPEYDKYDGIVYVLGTNRDKDSKMIKVKESTWEYIKKDVTEFNKQFRGSPMCVVDNMVEEEVPA